VPGPDGVLRWELRGIRIDVSTEEQLEQSETNKGQSRRGKLQRDGGTEEISPPEGAVQEP